jgi:hypothetical protein
LGFGGLTATLFGSVALLLLYFDFRLRAEGPDLRVAVDIEKLSPLEHAESEQDIVSQAVSPKRSHRFAVFISCALVVLDVFLLGQGIISAIFGALIVVLYLPYILSNSFRKDPAALKFHRKNISIYLIAVGLALGLIGGNIGIAHYRAQDLIAALKSYNAKYGQYPERLDQLVPEFMDKIPRAKYLGGDQVFTYNGYINDAVLS